MPKKKTLIFVSIIAALCILIVLSVTMSIQRYTKTVLISIDTENVDEDNSKGISEIKKQIEQAENSEADSKVMWTGSVCVTKYVSLGGKANTYYVCPFIVVKAPEELSDKGSEWNISLRFAMCAVQGSNIIQFNKHYEAKNITINGKFTDATVTEAAYTDMDVSSVNSGTLSYEFRDREISDDASGIFAKFSLTANAEKTSENTAAIVNWTFMLEENGHLINNFDGIQIEIPYTVK